MAGGGGRQQGRRRLACIGAARDCRPSMSSVDCCHAVRVAAARSQGYPVMAGQLKGHCAQPRAFIDYIRLPEHVRRTRISAAAWRMAPAGSSAPPCTCASRGGFVRLLAHCKGLRRRNPRPRGSGGRDGPLPLSAPQQAPSLCSRALCVTALHSTPEHSLPALWLPGSPALDIVSQAKSHMKKGVPER